MRQFIKCLFGFHDMRWRNPIGKWFIGNCVHCDSQRDFVAVDNKEADSMREYIRDQFTKSIRKSST